MLSLLLPILLVVALFQSCSDSLTVRFFGARLPLKSEVGGGPYDGKPESGYYCRVYDKISCHSPVQNLQSLLKVDSLGIHLIQDTCTSTSVNFFIDDAAVSFSSMAPNYLGVSRGIFKKCDVGTNDLPYPPQEMSDAYCVAKTNDLTVILSKNLENSDFSFNLAFTKDAQNRTVAGNSVIKASKTQGASYFSKSHAFNLDIEASNSQTTDGTLQVIVDDKPLNVELNCRIASEKPTVIINEDLEISPTWADTSQLLGYWKLNESNAANGTVIVDSSTYAANGTLLTDNGGLVKSNSSVAGGSLFFDGANDSIDIPLPTDGHLSFGMRSFTFMVWVKKTGNAGPFDMPIWHGGSSAGDAGYDIECGAPRVTGCVAYVSDGLGLPTSIKTAKFADSSSLIDRWVLLTAVVDRDLQQLRAYLDGVLISTTDISAVASITPNNNLFIGSSSSSSFFLGLIDDISIWDKALSESEIKEIFQRLRPKF